MLSINFTYCQRFVHKSELISMNSVFFYQQNKQRQFSFISQNINKNILNIYIPPGSYVHFFKAIFKEDIIENQIKKQNI